MAVVHDVENPGYGEFEISEVIIPEGATKIPEYAFEVQSIEELIIPDGVKIIGKRAFYCCQDLQRIVIPLSLETIGDGAFDLCDSLKEIIIGPVSIKGNFGRINFSYDEADGGDYFSGFEKNLIAAIEYIKTKKEVTDPTGDFDYYFMPQIAAGLWAAESSKEAEKYLYVCCEETMELLLEHDQSYQLQALLSSKSLKESGRIDDAIECVSIRLNNGEYNNEAAKILKSYISGDFNYSIPKPKYMVVRSSYDKTFLALDYKSVTGQEWNVAKKEACKISRTGNGNLMPNLVPCAYHKKSQAIIYDRFIIPKAVSKIAAGCFPLADTVLLCNKDTEIEENGISKKTKIIVIGSGKVSDYAQKNGNEIVLIPDGKPTPSEKKQYYHNDKYVCRGTIVLNPRTDNKAKKETAMEIVLSPEKGLNSLKIEYVAEGNKRDPITMDFRTGNTIAYLMQNDLFKFENAKMLEKQIKADTITEWALSDNLSQLFDSRIVFNERILPVLKKMNLPYDDLIKEFYPSVDLSASEEKIYSVINSLEVPDCNEEVLQSLFEPGNKLSIAFSNSKYRLCAVRYLEPNKYRFIGSPLTDIYIKDGIAYYCENNQPLSDVESRFAYTYIKQYHRLYDPMICDGMSENLKKLKTYLAELPQDLDRTVLSNEFGCTYSSFITEYEMLLPIVNDPSHINLYNFPQFTRDVKRVSKGLDYYLSGKIKEFCETEEGKFNAVVEGTKEYDVRIIIDNDSTIMKASCSCPYCERQKFLPVSLCKHILALLYKIRDEKNGSKMFKPKLVYPGDMMSGVIYSNHIEELSKPVSDSEASLVHIVNNSAGKTVSNTLNDSDFITNAKQADTKKPSSKDSQNPSDIALKPEATPEWLEINGNMIEKCREDAVDVVIPDGIKTICNDAFKYCKKLKSVVMPDSITRIGKYAFMFCTSLERINISNGITEISKDVFGELKNLKTLIIGAGVKSIDLSVLGDSEELLNIEVDKDNQYFSSRDGVLYDKSLTTLIMVFSRSRETVIIPNGVETIAENAFLGCENLNSITIPGSVKSIGERSFRGCNLNSIIIAGSVKSIGKEAFQECESLYTVEIQNGVETIAENAFLGCEKLNSIIIPGSVKSIGKKAFQFCESLHTVEIQNGVEIIDEEAFEYCKNLNGITIPGSVKSIGKSAFSSCENLHNVEIPNGVETIAEMAFCECKNLNSITIPGSVKSIGESAFIWCENLHTVEILNGVETIAESAFYGCKNLNSITIPRSVKSIGESAFRSCKNLTRVVLSSTITSIGENAFAFCDNLTGEGVIIANQEDNLKAQLNSINGKILAAKNKLNAPTPSVIKVNSIEIQISYLNTEKSRLGIFKGKQKRALQEQINALFSQIEMLKSSCFAERDNQARFFGEQIRMLEEERASVNNALTKEMEMVKRVWQMYIESKG